MIGDGDAVGVACQVVERILRSAEGAFAVDDPLFTKERSQERRKGLLRSQREEAAREHEFALMKGVLQAGDELAPKDAAEYSHGQEERVARVDPVLMIERQTTGGDHAMNVRMMQEVLAPGVEHAEETDLRAEMPGVGRNLQQSGGGSAKQQVVDDLLVV